MSTGSRLEANLRRPLLLSFLRWSTCSVLSETICRQHPETANACMYIIHLRPVQVNSNSYDNLPNLYKSELEHLPTETNNTCRKQEDLQPFLSARHHKKFASFKLSHLALRTFCHAPVGIWLQSWRSKFSSCVDWLNASSKSAAPSAPSVSVSKHLHCFVSIDLSKTPWDSDKCRHTIHPKPLQVNTKSNDNFTNSLQIWTRSVVAQPVFSGLRR